MHVDDKNKDILILGEEPVQVLDNSTLTTEPKYPINFTQPNKRFILSLHCNRSNSFLFVNATKMYQCKAKDYEINDHTLCLGNILKDFTTNNMKKKGLVGAVKFFFVDFGPINTNDILDINRYLIKKT